ncbi:hypothetical protein ACFX2I_035872 [Malus domestica]
MGREGSDEVQFSRVPGGVQEPRVHFRLRAHLASTPTSRIARLTTPPSGSTFSSLPPALSLSEPPSLALNLPYNFVLFPWDVLKMGMPTYSFSVQTSHLTSMAEEGFDFNACIYNAMLVSPHLSFLAQECGLHSADLISFLVELSCHVNGEAKEYGQGSCRFGTDQTSAGKERRFIPTNVATNLLVSLTDSSSRKQVGYLGGSTAGQSWSVDHMDAGKLAGESTQIVSRILDKALKAMLSPDFRLCLCLIPERVV